MLGKKLLPLVLLLSLSLSLAAELRIPLSTLGGVPDSLVLSVAELTEKEVLGALREAIHAHEGRHGRWAEEEKAAAVEAARVLTLRRRRTDALAAELFSRGVTSLVVLGAQGDGEALEAAAALCALNDAAGTGAVTTLAVFDCAARSLPALSMVVEGICPGAVKSTASACVWRARPGLTAPDLSASRQDRDERAVTNAGWLFIDDRPTFLESPSTLFPDHPFLTPLKYSLEVPLVDLPSLLRHNTSLPEATSRASTALLMDIEGAEYLALEDLVKDAEALAWVGSVHAELHGDMIPTLARTHEQRERAIRGALERAGVQVVFTRRSEQQPPGRR